MTSDFQLLRQRICKTIQSFAADCENNATTVVDDDDDDKDAIRTRLDPLFDEFHGNRSTPTIHSPHQDATDEEDDQQCSTSNAATTTSQSPFMEACIARNLTCLEYLWNKSQLNAKLGAVIGTPSDPLSRPTSNDDDANKNTAIHYAGLSGFHQALTFFHDNNLITEHNVLKLGSCCNSHNDTPLMMAALGGHIAFCKTWHGMAIALQSSSDDDDANNLDDNVIKRIWEMKNESKDTALSLACGHGNVDVVRFLLHDCDVTVDMEQVDKIRQSCKRMETASPALLQQEKYISKLESVRECSAILEAILTQRADAMAEQLLMMMEEKASPTKTKSQNKKKKKKKAKQKKVPPVASDSISNDSSTNKPKNDIKQNQKADEDVGIRVTTTTGSGNMAVVRVPGASYQANDLAASNAITLSSSTSPPILSMSNPTTAPSADEMFRQRFGEEGVIPNNNNTEVDAVMDALCLDVSMLLYTPHGMALNLSPSQLEAVRGILEKQMVAVREAQAIQSRLHAPTNLSSTQKTTRK